MSLENRFTESELLLLSNTPYAIGSAMIFAGGSGLGTIKEMIVNTKSFINGAKEFPANEIITGILPNLKDFEDTKEKSKDLKVHYKEWLKSKGVDSFEKMQTAVISDAKDVADILSSKANQNEANEYKDYILGFIFYKYLCDKEEKFALKEGYTKEDLVNLTEEDSESVAYFKENLGFFISYDNLFSTWITLGRDFDVSNVRDSL